jgi:hypothetical protein
VERCVDALKLPAKPPLFWALSRAFPGVVRSRTRWYARSHPWPRRGA